MKAYIESEVSFIFLLIVGFFQNNTIGNVKKYVPSGEIARMPHAWVTLTTMKLHADEPQ